MPTSQAIVRAPPKPTASTKQGIPMQYSGNNASTGNDDEDPKGYSQYVIDEDVNEATAHGNVLRTTLTANLQYIAQLLLLTAVLIHILVESIGYLSAH